MFSTFEPNPLALAVPILNSCTPFSSNTLARITKEIAIPIAIQYTNRDGSYDNKSITLSQFGVKKATKAIIFKTVVNFKNFPPFTQIILH
jgi:hypothetical protein